MSNRITIELCAEDRTRIDRLTDAIERAAVKPEQLAGQLALGLEILQPNKVAEPPKNTAEEAEKPAPANTQPKKEEPTPAENPQQAEAVKAKEEPTVTLEQIQQKVVQLAAGQNGAKKAKVRAVINAYGAKVSDLKDQPDKWTEVWDKLVELEKEV